MAVVAAVYFYDQSKQDLVAEGVKVNGVPIGGITRVQAEQKLSATLLKPLDRPVKVSYKDRTFTLTQKAASIGIDIRGSVDKALERSQQGDMFSRAWRNVRNESLNTELAADVSYNKPAIDKLVKRVQKSLDRKAKDAKLDLSEGFRRAHAVQDGPAREVQLAGQGRSSRRCSTPSKTEAVKVKTTVVQPKVSTKQIAEKYPAILVADRKNFKLQLYKNLKLEKTYGIAVGKVGHGHAGRALQHPEQGRQPGLARPELRLGGRPGRQGHRRATTPRTRSRPAGSGIYDGVGIHGTADDASIGSAASHGCLRMHIPDVEELYEQVPVGAPIYIA